ncbi:MAG: Rieske 2Fe-2S domain-containing protein [Saprospiraceae bacterium]|nr:Rieske 2Fe-2S domain-containing protein [Saprospiraceae bacterium]
MDRREFIEKVGLWSIAGVVAGEVLMSAGCKAPAIAFLDSSPEGNRVRILKANWPSGKDFVVVKHPTDEHPIFVHKEGDSFLALHLKCTHRGCTVHPEESRLSCPCHGSKFDLKGNVTKGPAKKPLSSYPVSIDNTSIYISYM